MALARILVDTSVWARLGKPRVDAVMRRLETARRFATCGVIELEVLFSARSGPEHNALRAERRDLVWLDMPDPVAWRAIEVQGLLARTAQHRAASIPDLLIAATAEHHGATVLHYDGDFDLIGRVTGQPVEWVLPRGSVD